MKEVEIYTDGACSGNPGPGGYAGILIYNTKEKIISGGELETTNNRMELLAVINSLKSLNSLNSLSHCNGNRAFIFSTELKIFLFRDYGLRNPYEKEFYFCRR